MRAYLVKLDSAGLGQTDHNSQDTGKAIGSIRYREFGFARAVLLPFDCRIPHRPQAEHLLPRPSNPRSDKRQILERQTLDLID